MTQEEFRDKKSRDYRKRRESYGIKDPVYLDEIEEAYYQGMVDADKHPNWISVEDELPPKKSEYVDNSILVLSTDGNNVYKSRYIYPSNKYLSGWFTYDHYALDNITHWMYLPSVEYLKDK